MTSEWTTNAPFVKTTVPSKIALFSWFRTVIFFDVIVVRDSSEATGFGATGCAANAIAIGRTTSRPALLGNFHVHIVENRELLAGQIANQPATRDLHSVSGQRHGVPR